MNLKPSDTILPRISVIMAVRNGATTIQQALDSVFEQTYDNLELIVMDGGSIDGTQAILEANAARIAYWESEIDRGIFHAWNKALGHATGDWMCFLGADDRYHAPEVMGRVATALLADEGRHLVAYGYKDKILADGGVRRSKGTVWDDKRRMAFRRGLMIPHPATFHHRSLFERHGPFDERFRIAGDFEFLLRELIDHDPLFVPEVVVDMAAGGLSDRPSSRSLVAREVYRARYMHGLVSSPPWRSRRLLRQLGTIWIDRNVRPRAARIRRIMTRGAGRPG